MQHGDKHSPSSTSSKLVAGIKFNRSVDFPPRKKIHFRSCKVVGFLFLFACVHDLRIVAFSFYLHLIQYNSFSFLEAGVCIKIRKPLCLGNIEYRI